MIPIDVLLVGRDYERAEGELNFAQHEMTHEAPWTVRVLVFVWFDTRAVSIPMSSMGLVYVPTFAMKIHQM